MELTQSRNWSRHGQTQLKQPCQQVIFPERPGTGNRRKYIVAPADFCSPSPTQIVPEHHGPERRINETGTPTPHRFTRQCVPGFPEFNTEIIHIGRGQQPGVINHGQRVLPVSYSFHWRHILMHKAVHCLKRNYLCRTDTPWPDMLVLNRILHQYFRKGRTRPLCVVMATGQGFGT